MKISQNNFTQTPGIYVWINTVNGKVYVGQSVNVFKRVQGELRDLRNDNFHNDHMQNAWNKYGEDVFAVGQLMECEKYELDGAEAAWGNHFDARNPEHGYNKREYGQGNHGHHDETCEKISDAQRARHGYDELVPEIMRYWNMGLTYAEIKKLTGAASEVVHRVVRENEHLIEPVTLTKVEAYEAVKNGVLSPKKAAALGKFQNLGSFKRWYNEWLIKNEN